MSGVLHGRYGDGAYGLIHDNCLTTWQADGSWVTQAFVQEQGGPPAVVNWTDNVYVSVDLSHAMYDLRAMREHDEAAA